MVCSLNPTGRQQYLCQLFSLTDEEKTIQTIVALLRKSGDQLEEKVSPSAFRSYTG